MKRHFRYPREVTSDRQRVRIAGRYALFAQIGAGGMASVHLGRLIGNVGFTRTVAIKVLHASYAKDPDFVAMLLDEARITALIQHPNVVSTLDIVTTGGELFVVMEYVHGLSLSELIDLCQANGEKIPVRVAAGILNGVLLGLHSAHETTNHGKPLGIVHRDVSPHNILVGQDGTPRLLDFGVAKAVGQRHVTRDGVIKGKLAYMAPEHLRGNATRQSDLYSAAVILWEMLTGKRISTTNEGGPISSDAIEPPSGSLAETGANLSVEQLDLIDEVVMRGLEGDPAKRFASAVEMALALEASIPLASAAEIGDWVSTLAHKELAERASLVAEIERARLDDLTVLPAKKMAAAPTSPLRTRALVAVGIGLIGVLLFMLVRSPSQPHRPLADTPAPEIAAAPVLAAPSVAPSPAASIPSAPPTNKTARPFSPPTHIKPPPHATPNRACDPPYVLDSAGRKVFKDECLR